MRFIKKSQGKESKVNNVTRIISLTVLSAILGVFASANAFAAQPSNDYSFSNESCSSNLVDPVGVVFAGTNASAENAGNAMAYHANWYYGGAAGQSLNVFRQTSSRICKPSNDGRNSVGLGPQGTSRFHARYWLSREIGGYPKTVATPHYERVTCGTNHAVIGNGNGPGGRSGFTYAKHELKQLFELGGHATSSVYWGNTRSFQQCNGNWAGGDGYLAVIYLNHLH